MKIDYKTQTRLLVFRYFRTERQPWWEMRLHLLSKKQLKKSSGHMSSTVDLSTFIHGITTISLPTMQDTGAKHKKKSCESLICSQHRNKSERPSFSKVCFIPQWDLFPLMLALTVCSYTLPLAFFCSRVRVGSVWTRGSWTTTAGYFLPSSSTSTFCPTEHSSRGR